MISKNSSEHRFIEKLTNIIDDNLEDEQFGVTQLATQVGLSRSQLHRKLKRIKGRSTSLFIREYRLEKALQLLRDNAGSSSEIAYRVGFGSPSYFNTCFRKYFGYTPGEVKFRISQTGSELDNDQKDTYKPEIEDIPKRKSGGHWSKQKVLLLVAILSLVGFALYHLGQSDSLTTNKSIAGTIQNGKSIAVLPFKNFSGEASMDPFCDGMTDEVISRLTKIKSFDKVSSRTSVFKYRNTNKSMPEIAGELGVTHILEGNFQKSGDKIKVRLQLINAPLDNHYWSEEYAGEWDSNDIFNIQAAVAENVAKHMNVVITDEETKAIQKTPTNNKEAYRIYLLAKSQKYKENESSFTNAIPLFQKAIALDSNFIEPYIGLADVWMTGGLVWGIYPEQEAWTNGKKALERAQQINSTYQGVEDMLVTGYFYYDWDFERVEPYLIKRLTNFVFDRTPAITADYAIKTGRYEEAVQAMDKSIAIDPSVGIFYTFKGEALMFMGRREEAIALMSSSMPLFSDDWWYLRESAKLLYYLGEYDKSSEQLDKLITNFPDNPPILIWLNTVYNHMDGKQNLVEQQLAELRGFYEKGSSGSPAWFIALYYCAAEDYEKAWEWLYKSYENHEVELTWFKEEPLLIPLRNDPRYKDLHLKIGFSKLENSLKALK
jgi:TolB-like protein/AraC-like DNA-binding protein